MISPIRLSVVFAAVVLLASSAFALDPRLKARLLIRSWRGVEAVQAVSDPSPAPNPDPMTGCTFGTAFLPCDLEAAR